MSCVTTFGVVMLKDISLHRPIWMGFDDLKPIVSRRFTKLRSREGAATSTSIEYGKVR